MSLSLFLSFSVSLFLSLSVSVSVSLFVDVNVTKPAEEAILIYVSALRQVFLDMPPPHRRKVFPLDTFLYTPSLSFPCSHCSSSPGLVLSLHRVLRYHQRSTIPSTLLCKIGSQLEERLLPTESFHLLLMVYIRYYKSLKN